MIESSLWRVLGEHPGISCDGCGVEAPLMGYRYKCKSCANHDICETCFKAWDGGKGTVANHLNQQKLSTNAADHTFAVHKDKGFKRGPGAGPTSNRARNRGTASEGERALSLGRSSRAPAPRPRRPRRSPTTPVRATRARPPASRRRTRGGSDPREEDQEERGSGRRGARARGVARVDPADLAGKKYKKCCGQCAK